MVIINWLKANCAVDRGTFKPGSQLEIRSLYHTDAPEAYDVFEVPPKILWFTRRDRLIASLPAKPLVPIQGRYHTANLWMLPAPKDKKNGRLTFVARTSDASSGTITSASMLITSEVQNTNTENTADASAKTTLIPGTDASLKLGRKSEKKTEIKFHVEPTLDPPVQIRLLQGIDVRIHIDKLVSEWFEEESGARSDAEELLAEALGEYFDGPWPVSFTPVKTELAPPEVVSYTMPIELSDNLRAVVCLQIDDLQHGTRTISEPRFITEVGGRVILSDLVPMLFDEQTQRLAKMFSNQLWNNGGELDPETRELGAPLVEVLGTSDIDDVIALLGAEQT